MLDVFILCNNNKGISLHDKEIKISQFAADTDLALDGSENSVKHTIDILKLYADVFRLKVNFDKTSLAVWFGSLKVQYCHIKHSSK